MPADVPTLPPPCPPPAGDRLLIDVAELARLTSLGVRTLRRMDAAREIPGRVVARRRVLFQTEVIRAWVRAGLPERDRWAALCDAAETR